MSLRQSLQLEGLVELLSPASAVQPERFEQGMAALAALGVQARPAVHALARSPLYFAGSAAERLADLHSAYGDPAVSVIMATRGGYGSNYLLDQIDWSLLAAHPKSFIGYSDLTGLLCALVDRCAQTALHGPMLAADFARPDGIHLPSLRAALRGESYLLGPAEALATLQPGSAEGVLYGGCLSILVSLLGTPFEPQTEGKLLFLEDVGAKPYQIDRMLWQLRAAGKLDRVSGIVFGEMLDCASPGAPAELLEQAIRSALSGFDGPVAFGLTSGHVSGQNVTLAMGRRARLCAAELCTLQVSSSGSMATTAL